MSSEKKSMTCISCPIGCQMTIEILNGKIDNVTGNSCKRGIEYATNEIISPKRMLTSTVLSFIDNITTYVPVKTNAPIPKELIFDAMNEINKVKIMKHMRLGDPVIKNIVGTGIDVILTDNA